MEIRDMPEEEYSCHYCGHKPLLRTQMRETYWCPICDKYIGIEEG